MTAPVLPQPKLIETPAFKDDRGVFEIWYNFEKFKSLGLEQIFVQDNFVHSEKRFTLRGMHLQISPFAQAKLVKCFRGEILDVIIDLRSQSESYLKPQLFELSEKKNQWLYVPRGFAHGYLTLTDHTYVYYKVDADYSPQHEVAIHYLDPDFQIPWPKEKFWVSGKDQAAPLWSAVQDRIKASLVD